MFIGTFFEKVKLALQTQACLRCEQKLEDERQFCSRCHEALAIREPKPLLQNPRMELHAATTFNAAVKKVLYGHKFYNRMEYVPQLTGLLVEYWASIPVPQGLSVAHPENVLVIPIPPHAGNPSLIDLFASRFARHFGYDYRHDALSWMREVRPQHRIHDKNQRLSNVAQSLHLKSGIASGYEKIIVVDDITTTGATLLEASRAFRDDVDEAITCLAIAQVGMGSQMRLVSD